MLRLSIVIPLYNAEKTITSLFARLQELYAERYSLEVVLVNDGSTDSTDAACRQLLQQATGNLTYLRLSRNFGEHNAVMAGLKSATGEVCVIMDDDFQNPPEEVEALVRELVRGYDVVYSAYPVKRDSLFRNFGSSLNDRIANFVLRKPADLYLSSFKALNRFLIDEIIRYDGPDPYIDAIILRSTSNIGTVEVRHDRRRAGRSGYTFRKLISLWGNAVVTYSLIPLRLLGIVGTVMTLVGIYVGGRTLIDAIIPHGDYPSEIEKLTAATLFFRGFNLLAISVVGEYVGRIYLALNRDPQYLVREKLSTPAMRRAGAASTTVAMSGEEGGRDPQS